MADTTPAPSVYEKKRILWWGRSDTCYSRNQIVIQCLRNQGWDIEYFRPNFSRLGNIEARIRGQKPVNLVWVPCFRQRDIGAASLWANKKGIPLIFDPLISAYDKQVYERKKRLPGSVSANRLLAKETRQFGLADIVIADTEAHAEFYHSVLGVNPQKLHVVPVGADESMFSPKDHPVSSNSVEVLFFGSYLPLQAPNTIIEAARHYIGPDVQWTLIGSGPLKPSCKEQAKGIPRLSFEDWIPYPELPSRIHKSDIVLGIFGTTDKAQRVIPNKVYQAMACARPVITLRSNAYPKEILNKSRTGIRWVTAGDPAELAKTVAQLAEHPHELRELGAQAKKTFDEYFCQETICTRLKRVISEISPEISPEISEGQASN